MDNVHNEWYDLRSQDDDTLLPEHYDKQNISCRNFPPAQEISTGGHS